MNTRTVLHGFSFELPRPASRPMPDARGAVKTAVPADWMERLASWAERQPAHHRMGSWQRRG